MPKKGAEKAKKGAEKGEEKPQNCKQICRKLLTFGNECAVMPNRLFSPTEPIAFNQLGRANGSRGGTGVGIRL